MYARYAAAQDGFLSSEPVIFRARSAVEEGIFMIGDASGVIDPLTGNGMAMAMQSALVAAPFIVDALTSRARAENAYRARHHQLFAPRIAWSRRVAALLSRPALLDAALALRKAGPLLVRKTRGDRELVERLIAES
jgi:flavin-dependent dehydrogenase